MTESAILDFLVSITSSGGGAFAAVAIYLKGIKDEAREAKEKIDAHLAWHLNKGK